MRMARAFIASVPLAVVLVAALVVPLMVIPGTFAFQSWPKSLGATVSESQVQVAPAPRTVLVRKPAARTAARATQGHGAVPHTAKTGFVPATRNAHGAPAPAGTRAHGHRSTAAVEAPEGSGPGRSNGDQPSTPSAPADTPSAPAEQPAPDPQTVPAPG